MGNVEQHNGAERGNGCRPEWHLHVASPRPAWKAQATLSPLSANSSAAGSLTASGTS